jgi:hypothetical protein
MAKPLLKKMFWGDQGEYCTVTWCVLECKVWRMGVDVKGPGLWVVRVGVDVMGSRLWLVIWPLLLSVLKLRVVLRQCQLHVCCTSGPLHVTISLCFKNYRDKFDIAVTALKEDSVQLWGCPQSVTRSRAQPTLRWFQHCKTAWRFLPSQVSKCPILSVGVVTANDFLSHSVSSGYSFLSILIFYFFFHLMFPFILFRFFFSASTLLSHFLFLITFSYIPFSESPSLCCPSWALWASFFHLPFFSPYIYPFLIPYLPFYRLFFLICFSLFTFSSPSFLLYLFSSLLHLLNLLSSSSFLLLVYSLIFFLFSICLLWPQDYTLSVIKDSIFKSEREMA